MYDRSNIKHYRYYTCKWYVVIASSSGSGWQKEAFVWQRYEALLKNVVSSHFTEAKARAHMKEGRTVPTYKLEFVPTFLLLPYRI